MQTGMGLKVRQRDCILCVYLDNLKRIPGAQWTSAFAAAALRTAMVVGWHDIVADRNVRFESS